VQCSQHRHRGAGGGRVGHGEHRGLAQLLTRAAWPGSARPSPGWCAAGCL
jgi:hypothetical protein